MHGEDKDYRDNGEEQNQPPIRRQPIRGVGRYIGCGCRRPFAYLLSDAPRARIIALVVARIGAVVVGGHGDRDFAIARHVAAAIGKVLRNEARSIEDCRPLLFACEWDIRYALSCRIGVGW